MLRALALPRYAARLIVIAAFAVFLCTVNGASAAGGIAPPLGAAASFSVLAALSMSAAGAGTTVSGDLGLSTNTATSRTGPWTVGGTEYFGPLSLAKTAHDDALGAFNNLAGQSSNGTWSASPWSPPAGVWTVASDTTFLGTITLSGGFNDVWVFQVGRDMTFTGSVIMTGNAQPCHVFWQIGRDATIALGSKLVGTLIASRDVTLVSGATVNGRIISLNSSLTTDGNNISGPTCAAAPTATNTATSTATATSTTTRTPTPTITPGGPTLTPTATNTPTPTATHVPASGPTATNTPVERESTNTPVPSAPTATNTPNITPGGPTLTPTPQFILPKTGASAGRDTTVPVVIGLAGLAGLAGYVGLRLRGRKASKH
jgi:Ice-binding-like